MEAPKQKTTATKATETVKKVRQFVKTMYTSAHEAKAQGKPVAYCMILSAYDEIVRAMDITPVWNENYGGLCAAKRDAERFLNRAQRDGYSDMLCSYVSTSIGFDALRKDLGGMPPNAPDGGMADPDMLLGTGMMICDPRYKWFQSLGRYRDTPVHCYSLLWPPTDADMEEVMPYYVKHLTEQLRGLVDFLERQTRKKMDWERLSQTVDLGEKTQRLWWETYQLRKSIPCPMPTQDAFNAFVPAYFALGSKEALDFYQELYQEVKYRVDNKIGVIPDEKYRLLWGGGLPPWHTLSMFDYFQSLGAVFPIEVTYRPYDPVEVPPSVTDPLERLAWRFMKQQTFRHEKAQKGSGVPEVELLLEFIEGYRIDGVVMHLAQTCRTWSLAQIHQLNVMKQYVKVPTLFIESDIVDVRMYSEADTQRRIDAFIETVAGYKTR